MFNAATRRWIQAVLLLLLGLYFLDNMLSGRIYFYINERFGWLSWLATVIFIALGVVGIADALRQQREERAHAEETSARERELRVEQQHRHDGQAAQAVERGDPPARSFGHCVPIPHTARCHSWAARFGAPG